MAGLVTGEVRAAVIRRRIRIPLRFADGYSTTATIISFAGLTDARQHVALELGRPAAGGLPLVRLHSECLTGDVFGSQRCDCGPQLREAVERISKHGGYVLYLRQEGRGIGLYEKLDAYALQDRGLDTYDANLALGHLADERDYTSAAQMLRALGASRIGLLSNNPDKGAQLGRLGITIAMQVPTALHLTGTNAAYLATKARRGGHDLLRRRLERVAEPHRHAGPLPGPADLGFVPNGKSVVVYGLLVQDAFSAGDPNHAFWSIAIEAQLYLVLPLLLLLARRVSARAMVGLVAAIVVTIGVLGPHVPLINSALVKFTPDLAVLFAVGLLAAGIVTADEHTRSRPWAGYALAATVPVIAVMVGKGSTWSNLNLFWLDRAWAPAVGCFLAAIATSRPRPVVRFLDSRLPRSLGSCSYSLYLTHWPIVIAVSYGLVLGRVATGTPTFLVLAAILLPVTVCFARLFAAVFEFPFQRHRGWKALHRAMSARLRQHGARRATGPRNQAGGRYRPARQHLVADGARPASRPDP